MLCHRIEHQRHAGKALAYKNDARINRPAIPSPADHGRFANHHIYNVRFTDCRTEEWYAVLVCNVFRHPARRAIGYNRSWRFSQYMVDADRQRIFFANVAAAFIDDRESIGVRILTETYVR